MILAGTASVSNLASLFSMSERVLRNRLALEGTTARRLIQQARLEMARQLLRTTQLTISEIGAAAGYADPPSFVRAFRIHLGGVTPGEWRQQDVSVRR
jgi:AraC-like DNA-binding protein